jgi:hypothetical protein
MDGSVLGDVRSGVGRHQLLIIANYVLKYWFEELALFDYIIKRIKINANDILFILFREGAGRVLAGIQRKRCARWLAVIDGDIAHSAGSRILDHK